jgi:hypothetical protein
MPPTLKHDNLSDFGSFRASIILALIASIGVYVISLFVKLITRSYHLSRDANERYHLTHVYLPLLKDKMVSDADRSIVLQSIFSRADTGLLNTELSLEMRSEGCVLCYEAA